MPSAALQAIRQTVKVQWPQSCERGAKAHLIRTARAGHARIMGDARRMGFQPAWVAYANHPGNRDIASVKIPGPIVYEYKYFADVVQFALDALRKASPVRSGDYVGSHTLYVNGQPVDAIPARLSASDEIWIANPVPYARRLEIGKTKAGRDFVIQVPNRIYERVAKQVVLPRFRNSAKVSFGYVTIPNAHVIKGGLSSHYATGRAAGKRGGGTMRKRRQRVGEMVRAPAIFISPLI